MAKGSKCSFCSELTLHVHESESFSECSNCGFIGWRVGTLVYPGPGMGVKCVNCRKQTLHFLTELADNKVEMFRCSTCLYAGVRPIPE